MPKKTPPKQNDYQPFQGIVLTDSFQLAEDREQQGMLRNFFPVNSARVKAQQKQPIRVILGNPPWSAGQKSENDASKNLKYPKLDARIQESYVAASSAPNKRHLYDSYIRAIRWASDRLGDEGLIAFVTNGSLIDGNAMAGLRKCMAEEFDAIYCFNLRGDARTSGEQRKREAGNVFASGSRTTVAITFFIKKKGTADAKKTKQARIYYHDIGDYLSRGQKLAKIIAAQSIAGLEWERITPDANHDWINQRDAAFDSYRPIGTDEGKKRMLRWIEGKGGILDAAPSASESIPPIFGAYSLGLNSNRDAWVYNFSKEALSQNMQAMISFYNKQRLAYAQAQRTSPTLQVDAFIDKDERKIKWSSSLKSSLLLAKKISFAEGKMRPAIYRPFCRQWLYYDEMLNHRQGRQPLFFPSAQSKNRAICVSGIGANQFSALMVDTLPDLSLIGATQCFPFYVYDAQGRRHDNISEASLAAFRAHCKNKRISKEDIFHYCYGLLHWPHYLERFSADLLKGLPRLPYARDFAAFADAGARLAELHCNYEKAAEYAGLSVAQAGAQSQQAARDWLKGKGAQLRLAKMRFAKNPERKSQSNKQGLDKSRIYFHDALCITNIPLKAYDYVVGAKPALEWVMDRYQLSTHKDSGIRNDPNAWPGGARYALSLLCRVIGLSMETVEIVQGLAGAE